MDSATLLSISPSEKSTALNATDIAADQSLNSHIACRADPVLEIAGFAVGQNIRLASEVLGDENGGDGAHEVSSTVVALILVGKLSGNALEAIQCVDGWLGGVIEFDGAGVVVVQLLGCDRTGGRACDEEGRDESCEVHDDGCLALDRRAASRLYEFVICLDVRSFGFGVGRGNYFLSSV